MGLYAYGRMLFMTHTDTIIVILKNLPHPQELNSILCIWYKIVNIECTQSGIYFPYASS